VKEQAAARNLFLTFDVITLTNEPLESGIEVEQFLGESFFFMLITENMAAVRNAEILWSKYNVGRICSNGNMHISGYTN
jgi:hypothetical protein